MKVRTSKHMLFAFPIGVQCNSVRVKLNFVKTYIKDNGLSLQWRVSDGTIEVFPEFSRYVDMELTNDCNARCIFCPRMKMKKVGYMAEDVFLHAIDKIKKANIGKIVFIGRGEPLLHPKSLDFIRYIRDNTGLNLEIFTIGEVLNEELVDALADINDNILCLRLNVSLHSMDHATHRKLVGLELKRIVKNIRYLMTKKGKLEYSLCFVMNKINEGEMQKLRKVFDNAGIGHVDISLVYNKGGHVRNMEVFDTDFYVRNMAASAEDNLPERKLCKYTYDHLSYYVNYKGDFTICHDDFDDRFRLGSILMDDFASIDKKIEKLKKAGGTEQCKQCTKYLREYFHGEDKDTEALPLGKITL